MEESIPARSFLNQVLTLLVPNQCSYNPIKSFGGMLGTLGGMCDTWNMLQFYFVEIGFGPHPLFPTFKIKHYKF